jgi:aminoglycoside phosphotransferase (APT) family kinase protein
METTAPAPVGGNRLAWHDLPDRLRVHLEAAVGSPVVSATSKEGGFSPALASVLMLADGRSVFAKAVSLSRNDFTVAAIRREVQVLAELPTTVAAPQLLWSYDDGEWVALVIDAVDGHNPGLPWHREDLERFLAAMTVLAESLTPSPIVAKLFTDSVEEFTRWSQMADDPAMTARLDPEFRSHIAEMIQLEKSWATAVDGTSLLHGDMRADNFILTKTGFAVVDWPSVCIGAPWVDLLYALPSISMYGGGDPDRLWLEHPLSRGVDADAVNAALAGVIGFFIWRSLEPPVPLLPTIRQFQRAQGLAAYRWLAGRMGWSS